jgi:excisionase family DNA binding protein
MPSRPRNAELISRNLGRKYSFSAKLEGHSDQRLKGDSRRRLNVDGNNERLLTPGEVATLFRVDPKTVTRWAASGRITSIRTPGGHRRFRETEVRALLRGDSEPAPQGHPAA